MANITIATPAITSTTGVFSCTALAAPLPVGQAVNISGVFSSGGVVGQKSNGVYYVIGTPTTTAFQLSKTKGGAPITTVASTGAITGVTITTVDEATVYVQRNCKNSADAVKLLKANNVRVHAVMVTGSSKNRKAMAAATSNAKTTPQVFINGAHVGTLKQLKSSSLINPNAKLKART